MANKNVSGSNAFGELVKAKLIELHWSQRDLGRRILKGPTYVNYLVRGENPGARSGKFRPARDVVLLTARTLDIPIDEALTAAGYTPGPADHDRFAVQTAALDRPRKAKSPDEEHLFDIARSAALDALTSQAADKAAGKSRPSSTDGIKIELGPGVHLILSGAGANMAKADIARYKLAFRAAYESVQAQIDTERRRK